LVLFFSFNVFSQEDKNEEYEVFDVVYTKEYGALKGEIMSFDEATGGIVFKDRKGNTYSFGREDYTHFKENQSFPVKQKKDFVLHERKNNEIAFEAGFSFAGFSLNQYFDDSGYVLDQGNRTYSEGALMLKVAGGKFLDTKNFVGLTADYAVSSWSKNIFSFGARFKHYYDGQKKNLGLYIPIELQFTSIQGDSYISLNDTIYTDQGWEWPTDVDIKTDFQALTLGVGHGFSMMLANKKSLAIEVSVVNFFGIKDEYENGDFDPIESDDTFDGIGFKGALLFGF